MRMFVYAGRTGKEILRDPLNLAFGLGFPIVLLLLMSAIQASIPVSLFEIGQLTPGIAVFGLSFMTLFSAMLISKDRTSSFLERLFTTPLTPADFILGYMLPILPIGLAQSAICYLTAFALGLPVTVHVLLSILLMLPVSLLFTAMGLLFGSLLNDKQVGGICGALLTNVCAWLSGAWFDLKLVGGAFQNVADALPFVHAVEMHRAILSGSLENIFPHIWWVIGYALLLTVISVLVFMRKMKRN